MNRLMETSNLNYVSFHDSDIPDMKWTAIAFWPVGREKGSDIFGDFSLA